MKYFKLYYIAGVNRKFYCSKINSEIPDERFIEEEKFAGIFTSIVANRMIKESRLSLIKEEVKNHV